MRQFHRPAEIVIGYDEVAFTAEGVRRMREAWAAAASRRVRTMPFLRTSREEAPALLFTFGDFADAGDAIEFLDAVASPAWAEARAAACALVEPAGEVAPHVQVRFDVGPVIVRGTVPARSRAGAEAALVTLRIAARRVADVLPSLPPEARLVTLEFREGGWVPVQARGYRATGPVTVDLEELA